MRAVDVMTRDVATVHKDTPLTEIADLLLSQRISGVPVVEENGHLVGMVSEADLMWRAEGEGEHRRSWWTSLLSGRSLMAADFIRTHGTCAEDIMTHNVVTVAEDTPIDQLIDIFETKRIKRLPVMRDNRVIGIVSRKDLLRSLAAQRSADLPGGDEALRDRLLDMLSGQPWINLSLVNVTVENGIVRFSGLVGSEAERRALHVAAHSTGIRQIDDQLTIGHTPSGGI